MYQSSEHAKFIEDILSSEPSHYAGDPELDELVSFVKDLDLAVYSSLTIKEDVILDMAIDYVSNYSGYTPGEVMEQGHIFFSEDPIIIYSTKPEASDRTLIWANGMINITSNENYYITLMLDKKLLKMIDDAQTD